MKDRALWIQNWRCASIRSPSIDLHAVLCLRVREGPGAERPHPSRERRKGSSGAAAAASAGTSDDGESWWKAGLDDVARANLLGSGGAQVVRRKVQRPQLEAVLTPELEADRVGRGGVRVERRNTGKRPYTGYVADLVRKSRKVFHKSPETMKSTPLTRSPARRRLRLSLPDVIQPTVSVLTPLRRTC